MGTQQASLCFKVVYMYTLAFEFLAHGASFFVEGEAKKRRYSNLKQGFSTKPSAKNGVHGC